MNPNSMRPRQLTACAAGAFLAAAFVATVNLPAFAQGEPAATDQDQHKDTTKPAEQKPAAPAAKPAEHAPEAKPAPAKPDERHAAANPGAQHETRTTTTTRTSYHITSTTTLKSHYQSRFASIDRAHRPSFVVGASFPREYVVNIEPVPAEFLVGLPPVPAGYVVGYYQGYVIVYEPASFVIVDVVDLTI